MCPPIVRKERMQKDETIYRIKPANEDGVGAEILRGEVRAHKESVYPPDRLHILRGSRNLTRFLRMTSRECCIEVRQFGPSSNNNNLTVVMA
jgi:hypothetical protein